MLTTLYLATPSFMHLLNSLHNLKARRRILSLNSFLFFFHVLGIAYACKHTYSLSPSSLSCHSSHEKNSSLMNGIFKLEKMLSFAIFQYRVASKKCAQIGFTLRMCRNAKEIVMVKRNMIRRTV